MGKKRLPEKYRYYDPADITTDDDLYLYWHVATPWKRKQLARAAWKEEAEAKRKAGAA